jgi:hypothetical protein
MKTTNCKRCGTAIEFRTDKRMWLTPGSKGTNGRWCQTTPEKPVQVHVPDYDAVVESVEEK